jgi:hypothetical protein
VIAVHARSHSVRHDVLANPLQLVLRAILQVQEGFQADFLALSLSTSRQLDNTHTQKEMERKGAVTNSINLNINKLMVSPPALGSGGGISRFVIVFFECVRNDGCD